LGRYVVSKILNIDKNKVNFNVTLLGGGFGRRLEIDFIAQAAQIAKNLEGKVVRMLLIRYPI
jgi:isoquinoline 1-oxidoreductase beta subunit